MKICTQITACDTEILLFIQEHLRSDAWNGFWKWITSLGDFGWFWILLALLLLFPKKTRNIGIIALTSLAINILLTNITLKPLIPIIPKPFGYSFPSGHTSASFASAFVYYRMLPKKYGIPALILAALIGISRLYVGVHYPSDVIGGILVALFSSVVSYKLLNKRIRLS